MKLRANKKAPLTAKPLSTLTAYVKKDITESKKKHPTLLFAMTGLLLLELLVAFVMFIFVQSRNIVTTGLGIKEVFLIIFTIIVACAALQLVFKSISNLIKIKQVENLFLGLTIVSVIAMLTGSITIISEIYKPTLPMYTTYSFVSNQTGGNSDGNMALSLVCFGLNKYKDHPVVGQFLDCYANLTDTIGGNFRIGKPVEVRSMKVTFPEGGTPKESSVGVTPVSNGRSILYNGIRIPINRTEQGGLTDFKLIFVFYGDNPPNYEFNVDSGFMSYTAISSEEYNRRQNEKMGLYLTAIGLSLFAPIAGIKNLMDIWDRHKKSTPKK